jgi:predicted ester cyclase
MSDTNSQIVRRLLEDVWTQGDLSLLPELLEDNAVSHPMPQVGPLHGPDEYKSFIAVLKSAFHNMQFSIEDQFSCENKVATRWIASVSDESGEARQDAHTGGKLTIDGTTLTHHDNSGRICAEWATWDTGSLLQSASGPRVFALLSIKV